MVFMPDSKNLGDNDAQVLSRFYDRQPGPRRLQRGNLLPHSRRDLFAPRNYVQLWKVVLSLCLADFNARLRASECRLIHVTRAFGGLPIPHNLQLHVTSAQRVVNSVVAVVVERPLAAVGL